MIRVRDMIIYTPVDSILEVLRQYLLDTGVIRFEKIKVTGNNVMTNCPFHSDGREKKPSFGISEKGECHCFACGYATDNFSLFISNVLGYENDFGRNGESWLLSRLISSPYQDRTVNFNLSRYNSSASGILNTVSEEELDSYRYIHPYMYQRHLDDRIIDMFDVGYDSSRNCLTFPIWDINGRVIFVATRSVVGKFFTLPEYQNKPVYAANFIVSMKCSYAVIVESILNALTLWKYNIPAVALLGTGSHCQYNILRQLPVKKYIISLDSDNAGRRGEDKLIRNLQNCKILRRYVLPSGVDINDLDDKVLSLKEHFI